MSQTYNVYCDESCHLEHDGFKVMVLGGVWCLADKAREINQRLREIKARHGLSPAVEVKWTKISPAKTAFYLDLVDYFFDDDDLCFRGLLVPDKKVLDHDGHGQTHDEWYYKMYFTMLKAVLSPQERFRVYLDIKDTRGGSKVKKLHEVLCGSMYDFDAHIVEKLQVVRSHEVEIMQLADLLIGALSYTNRGLAGNAGKVAVVERIKARSHLTLQRSTLLRARKMNLFRWEGGRPEGT
jgi:hypothetical protein